MTSQITDGGKHKSKVVENPGTRTPGNHSSDPCTRVFFYFFWREFILKKNDFFFITNMSRSVFLVNNSLVLFFLRTSHLKLCFLSVFPLFLS